MTGDRPDPCAEAALRQMGTVLAVAPPFHVERLTPPPRERKPTPSCAEGGPHRYPPLTTSPACEVCGVTPGASAVAGLARLDAAAKLDEAFQ